jgi:hypothetical protein
LDVPVWNLKYYSGIRDAFGGTHKTIQYRISIYGKENLKEFGKIGFSIQMHKERLERALAKYS